MGGVTESIRLRKRSTLTYTIERWVVIQYGGKTKIVTHLKGQSRENKGGGRMEITALGLWTLSGGVVILLGGLLALRTKILEIRNAMEEQEKIHRGELNELRTLIKRPT